MGGNGCGWVTLLAHCVNVKQPAAVAIPDKQTAEHYRCTNFICPLHKVDKCDTSRPEKHLRNRSVARRKGGSKENVAATAWAVSTVICLVSRLASIYTIDSEIKLFPDLSGSFVLFTNSLIVDVGAT